MATGSPSSPRDAGGSTAGPDGPASRSDLPTVVTNPQAPIAGASSQTQVTLTPSGPTPTPAPAPQNRTIVTDLNIDAGAGQGSPSQLLSAPSHDPASHEVWGDFELGSQLGKGGMGAVYRGRQISLDRPVAIKVLPQHLSENESFRQRFALEAKAIAQISSPNIVQVYAAGQHQGQHYFAMEFVEGTDLAVKLKQGFRPTFRQALDLILQAARGIAAAGELGIVHRDIKPANMMVTTRNVVKIMDFGLVKLASNSEHGLTMAGTIMGTVSYFSPEQGRGETCDQRTDIYALGVVMYELLTGKLPFVGADATSVIYQHIHAAPRKPKEIDPNIPEDYQAVVLKCMQKRPQDRYQNAQELVDDLESLIDGRSPKTAFLDPAALRAGATLSKTASFAREHAPRRRGLVFVVLILLAAAGAGTVAVLHSQGIDIPGILPAQHAQGPATPGPTGGPGPDATGDGIPAVITSLIRNQQLDQADQMVLRGLQQHPGLPAWTAAATAVGGALVADAQTALIGNDYQKARVRADQAKALIGGTVAVAALEKDISAHDHSVSQREDLLTQARNLRAANQLSESDARLQLLSTIDPGDPEVAKEIAINSKLRGHDSQESEAAADQNQRGDAFMAERDYTAAQLAYSSALQHDAGSVKARQGLDQVSQARALVSAAQQRFAVAIKKRDLTAAQGVLNDLRALVSSSSPEMVMAQKEFEDSRLVEEDQHRRAAEHEAALKALAARTRAILADPKIDVTAMEKALADFVAQAGPDRPERASLQTMIDDRRARMALSSTLARLDTAMLHQDKAALRAIVIDPSFADSLAALMGMAGLTFSEEVTAFDREGAQAHATVLLRQGLATFPEQVLTYHYDLKADGQGWQVTAAHLISK